MKTHTGWDNQQSLFDVECNNDITAAPKLDIVKARFLESGEYSWEELFDGFTELYAITYSSGMQFIKKVLGKCEKAEIVFGCETVLGPSMETVVAMQQISLETIRDNKSLSFFADKIEEGVLSLYLSKDTKSHEKIYALRSKEGKTRVITGSANMSRSAFCGLQRENIIWFDDQEAFDYYYRLFCEFRDTCSSSVSLEIAKKYADEERDPRDSIDELPIVKEIEKKSVIILEDSSDEEANPEIVTTVKGLAQELRPLLPKRTSGKGKFVISGVETKQLTKKYKLHLNEEKEKAKIHPKLHIDYERDAVSFNGKLLDLTPSADKIKADIQCVLSYFSSFESFYGNVQDSQKDYFAFMNWFFASPFMPYLRLIGNQNNYAVTSFPTVGIIYGESNGGKSTFVRLLTKLMCGYNVPMNSSGDFTATQMDALRIACEGVPINVDDLAKTQFANNSEKIIKDDQWGIAEKRINYPAITISTNKIPSLTQDITKRTVTCYIDARIDKDAGAKNAKKINESMNQATTALYSEYCRRMFEQIHLMVDRMESGENDYFPDALQLSSMVLYGIFSAFTDGAPSYVTELQYKDYFGDKAVGRKAMQKIKIAWKNEPKQFKIDRKNNKLTYAYPENGNLHELTYLQQELPPSLNVKRTATCIIMDLDAAEAFFEEKFKKKWL